MRIKLFRSLPFFALLTVTTGCSYYYDSKADDMVQRQMDAMVFVKGGEFMMGNPGGWSVRHDTWPPHKVKLDDFHIQKYEVTQGDFELFQTVTGYISSDKRYDERRDENPERYEAELPAVASWTDATAFCSWLADRSGKPVSLPTEAQWEYAARSEGKMLKYGTKSGEAKADINMAAGPDKNVSSSRERDEVLPLKPGSFPPNAIGLYDMSGNAGEWVFDYYQEDYYKNSQINDPRGPKTGHTSILPGQVERVWRGGSYQEFIGNTTVTRRSDPQDYAFGKTGFRCAY
ncbi:formylglycine-generating enzyme family protein [Marinobacter mangrovi]|uniref:formylglycine-generating enzyme family protein n=1 Tax=Marinobacter mangrovi TaxID=2803918 RepID=UPI0019315A9F|nr:SUMF1/EgtB/PvdO family nonheme iron enzyme [Marinobacter mangrovi]